MKKRIYITGAADLQENQQYAALEAVSKYYARLAYHVENRFDTDHALKLDHELERKGKPSEAGYAGHAIQVLSECSMLILLPGYAHSKRCQIELAFAILFQIPIYEAYSHTRLHFNADFQIDVCDLGDDAGRLSNIVKRLGAKFIGSKSEERLISAFG